MEKLKYKSFTWPENPQQYRVESRRDMMSHVDEAGMQQFDGLGPWKRIITGNGSFLGPEAYNAFKILQELTMNREAGLLVHPVWGTVSAFLTELVLEQEPRTDYVAYSFVFREADTEGKLIV